MFDAHPDQSFGNCNGVFGDQLLEGNEEASLDGDAAGNGRVPIHRNELCKWAADQKDI